MERDRRSFLKLGVAAGIGLVVGETKIPVGRIINRAVEKTTNRPTGNANQRQQMEEHCAKSDDFNTCVQHFKYTPKQNTYNICIGPTLEEFAFRANPSFIVSMLEQREDPVAVVLYGTGGWSMTRRELFAGVLSSIFFGLTHNLTSTGIDTKTIPASITFSGMIYWYLQRKFGFVANTLAHAWFNFRVL